MDVPPDSTPIISLCWHIVQRSTLFHLNSSALHFVQLHACVLTKRWFISTFGSSIDASGLFCVRWCENVEKIVIIALVDFFTRISLLTLQTLVIRHLLEFHHGSEDVCHGKFDRWSATHFSDVRGALRPRGTPQHKQRRSCLRHNHCSLPSSLPTRQVRSVW